MEVVASLQGFSSSKCHPPSHPPPQQAGPHKESQPGSPQPPTPSPTYERLRDTIARRMRMSHAYQPLMLMELLGHGLAWQQPAPPPSRT